MKITHIHARQILDSRGNPTVETDVILENGIMGRAAVPSGASTGIHEAVELRDKNPKIYNGKSVITAVANVNGEIANAITGKDVTSQKEIDETMIALDGTENKSRLGANAILSVSMAVAKAASQEKKLHLFEYIGELAHVKHFYLPRPMVLLLEGGKHGNWATDLQEYMILARKNAFSSFEETIQAASEIFVALEKILDKKGFATGVGFEGAFCPRELTSNEDGFDLIIKAVEAAGYTMDTHFGIAIDGAASEFYENGKYTLKSEGNKEYTSREWSEKIINWTKKFPIVSLEDMHSEDSWEEWEFLTSQIGSKIQIVGDDLVTTNVTRIQKAIDIQAINSVLIKVNQIGTVTETINAVQLTQKAGFTSIVSHRGSESNDDFIADFAVGTRSEEVKFGGPDRGERIAKYNELLRIEELIKK